MVDSEYLGSALPATSCVTLDNLLTLSLKPNFLSCKIEMIKAFSS